MCRGGPCPIPRMAWLLDSGWRCTHRSRVGRLRCGCGLVVGAEPRQTTSASGNSAVLPAVRGRGRRSRSPSRSVTRCRGPRDSWRSFLGRCHRAGVVAAPCGCLTNAAPLGRVSHFDTVISRLAAIATRNDERAARAREAAECIRIARDYRWVGLYDVTSSEIRAIGWTGPTPPAFPTFPRTQGLNGAAIATGRPVIINDVRTDSRYLTTFSTTLAEAIVPVRSGTRIAGTIDVESDRVDAFSAEDEEFLEECAAALQPLWS